MTVAAALVRQECFGRYVCNLPDFFILMCTLIQGTSAEDIERLLEKLEDCFQEFQRQRQRKISTN